MLNLTIPAINIEFYKDYEQSAVKRKLFEIREKYKQEIDEAASLTKVPAEVITSFIFIESDGNKDVVSAANAVGLMQLQPETATNIPFIEHQNKQLTNGEVAALTRYLGKSKVDCILSMKWQNQPVKCATQIKNVSGGQIGIIITKEDLKIAGLNILLGSMMIGMFIDTYTENGMIRLDKVVVRYNTGKKKITGNDIKETMDGLPRETRSYILKLLGKGSTLDLMLNSK